ncbi:MAG TPA: class III extradiol dioxygenase subunit B-like domain-containing protein [Candidatus Methylomirabilis sp.]|nr:class III extradiol dioxygenase subunit B-like domain-containing protein [Candidatus Methylomirabilis sp.]
MSLKLAAIVPHPPLLVPAIGKENLLRLENTKKAYDKIAASLREEKIETILLISSHGPLNPDAWQINIGAEFNIDFEEFGEFTARASVSGDLELAQNIREDLIELPTVRAINETKLDHGCSVPLFSLLVGSRPGEIKPKNDKNISLVPFYISGVGLPEHFALGKKIRSRLVKGRKKIAVLASGDLSHTLAKNSPAGFAPRSAKFDQKIISCLIEKKIDEFLNLEEELIREAKPCGLRAIALLLGILDGNAYDVETSAYESPFGIGYLSLLFKPLPT